MPNQASVQRLVGVARVCDDIAQLSATFQTVCKSETCSEWQPSEDGLSACFVWPFGAMTVSEEVKAGARRCRDIASLNRSEAVRPHSFCCAPLRGQNTIRKGNMVEESAKIESKIGILVRFWV